MVPLTRLQVISIVKEADKKLALPEDEIDALYHDLNWTLSKMGFYVNIEVRPAQAVKAAKALKRVLRNLKVQSQPVYIKQLLKSLAFHQSIIKSPKDFSPSLCSQNAVDHVETLFRGIDRALKSVTETNVKEINGLIPHMNVDELIRLRLPTIFPVFFKRKCGNSLDGPGTRFIKAVLREAGIRTRKGTMFGADAIVKCRSRGPRNRLPPYRDICNPWRNHGQASQLN
jgi:hypothetical protein